MSSISLACAEIPFKAWLNIGQCLAERRIGRGRFVSEFERKIAKYFGVRNALCVANGTLADAIMLMTLKELRPGKTEVILPALTFVAQANAVLLAGLKPVFVDVNFTFQMDTIKAFEAVNDNTLCVFACHLVGKYCHAVDFREFGVPIVEDCCEAMGARHEWHKAGTSGLAGAFSMFPSHTITTGEGGFIITDSDKFYEIANSIHNHGKWKTQDFDFEFVGLNAKMTNLQAAIGCSLIDRIDEVNEKRKYNVGLYNMFLGNNFSASAPHCYPLIYTNKEHRDKALLILKENGIEARKLMGCVPDYECYKKRFGEQKFLNARQFANTGLFLPIHQCLKKGEIERICGVVRKTGW